MNIKLEQLTLINKESIEVVPFASCLSFFHGEMSSGKSTILALVDYCFGARFQRTPALASELISVQLKLKMAGNEVIIERVPSEPNYVQVSWRSVDGGFHQCSAPLRPPQATLPIWDENIFSFSDLMFYMLGIEPIKVKKRTLDVDSTMIRLSFRDLLEFVYLDQDRLDSEFFLLEVPIRKEKSQDAIRYFVGFWSERLNELENELQEIRQLQRSKRDAVSQIKEFLARFDFGSESKIDDELAALYAEEALIDIKLGRLKEGFNPEEYISHEEKSRLEFLVRTVAEINESMTDLDIRIREQESLESELISLKFKAARTNAAHMVLDGVEFEYCPACSTPVDKHHAMVCYLCKTPNADDKTAVPTAVDVIRQDLDERIDDLKQSVARHRRAIKPLRARLEEMTENRRDAEDRLNSRLRTYESEYLAQSRDFEKRLSTIQERSRLLNRIKEMPAEIEKVYVEADAYNLKIGELRRRIDEEQKSLKTAEVNFVSIEKNYKNILLAIHFPGFSAGDEIVISRKTLIPEYWQSGDERKSWTFFDAGSGGKKTLLKICFALALHKTAAENDLPIPKILFIDSPMKNITPDVNKDIFENFYNEVYRLLSTSLAEWQVIIVDQTYVAPPESVGEHLHRLMRRDDPNFPPLISYYHNA